MLRKSTLVLMIVLCGFMFYTGCGEDDDGGGQGEPTPTPTASPPPGGGVPPPDEVAEACMKCPCKYFDVPMTPECWASGIKGPKFDTNMEGPGARCSVHPDDLGFQDGIAAFGAIEEGCSDGAQACCRIKGINERCEDAPEVADQAISFEQLTSCEACIEGYATELNFTLLISQLGDGVSGGPPYECTTLQ